MAGKGSSGPLSCNAGADAREVGIAFAKDNTALCDAVNSLLQTLHGNGEFARLEARSFPNLAKS